jgi:hypothetical protein
MFSLKSIKSPNPALCITTNPSNVNCALVQTHDHLILASPKVWITLRDRGEIRNIKTATHHRLYSLLTTAYWLSQCHHHPLQPWP